MPRRRHRRHRHRHSHNHTENVKKSEDTSPAKEHGVILSDSSNDEKTFVNQTPSNCNEGNKHTKNSTTSNNDLTPKSRKQGSLNVTNLNLLFGNNLDYRYENVETDTDTCLGGNRVSFKTCLNSNVSRLNVPIDKPLTVNESTQTCTEPDVPPPLKQCNEIYGTPKLSQPVHQKIENPSSNPNRQVIYGNEININPYLKNAGSMFGKMDSFPEIFFSPKLLENKLSSTPIERIRNFRGIDNGCVENSLLDVSGKLTSPGTPNLKSNNNFAGDKINSKEKRIRQFRQQTLNISRRKSIVLSPKSRTFAKISRINISKETVEIEISVDRKSNLQTRERLFSTLKKYGRATRIWTAKLFGIFARLGANLKNTLCRNNSSLVASNMTNGNTNCARCKEYKEQIERQQEEIARHKKEIEQHTKEIENNRLQHEQQQEELTKLKAALNDVQTSVEALKDQLSKCAATPHAGFVLPSLLPPCGPPPPPLPPPPPPPPPPMPLLMPTSTSLKITKKEKSEVKTQPTRPIISLEDILKVKLKKTSDRARVTSTPRSRFSTPISSSSTSDVLQQVRLRPPSSGGNPAYSPAATTPLAELPTSPMSTMCRLLKVDTAPRLKRLRRPSAYSADSLYRKPTTADRRERDAMMMT